MSADATEGLEKSRALWLAIRNRDIYVSALCEDVLKVTLPTFFNWRRRDRRGSPSGGEIFMMDQIMKVLNQMDDADEFITTGGKHHRMQCNTERFLNRVRAELYA